MKSPTFSHRTLFVALMLVVWVGVVGCGSAAKEGGKAAQESAQPTPKPKASDTTPAPAKETPAPTANAEVPAPKKAETVTAEQPLDEQKVIEKIEAWGGKVNVTGNAAAQKSNPTPPVVSVVLNQKLTTPDDLAILTALPQLESLDFRGANIGDSALSHVGKLKSLKTLKVSGAAVTDAGLDHLASLVELTHLNLLASAVTGKGLPKLHSLTKLKYLDLDATQVDDSGLAELAAFKNLEETHLGKQPASKEVEGTKEKVYFDRGKILITDAGLKELKNLPNLKILYLYGGGITDAGLADLEKLSQLKVLILNGTFVTDAGVATLQQKLPKCKISLMTKRSRTDPNL